MGFKFRPTKTSVQTSIQISISPGIWAVFICGVVLFLSTIFVTRWTSSGPTVFSPEELQAPINNSLPSAKVPNSSQRNFLPLTKPSDVSQNDSIVLSSPSDVSQNNSLYSSDLSQKDALVSPSQLNLSQSQSHSAVLPLQINLSQVRFLPEFLQPPDQPFDLWLPTLIVAYICILLPFIPSNNWTRLIVRTLLLILVIRYFVWRTIASLDLSHWAIATFSLLIYFIEVIGIISLVLHIPQSIWSSAKKRTAQADRYSQNIMSGKYLPSVDIFVPTYNEPEQIVCRTVIGCQAMEYPNKTVYILDDGRRPHIRALAEKLGCEYITRPENVINKHAKAGNLNNALPQTQGELIAIMDADFVPFKNFLTRTVGFFQQQKVALVQTPQTFYNSDHHARNLGIDHLLYDDLASFFGFSLSCRDVTNSVLCCGTSYVVRRSCLEAVGGYNTTCLAEDSPTSTSMLTRGWQLIYLNEVLSMGESTRTYLDFIKQRTRWHHGNYQIFCCGKEIPIWSTMNWVQKSYFFTFFLGSFQPLFRAIFMMTPLVSICLGISPLKSTPSESLYYFVPFILLQIGSTGWATEYTASFFWNEVYDVILCFPNLKCLFLAIRDPFGLPFKVTRKGVRAETKNYNLNQTWPLLIGIVLSIAVLCLHLVGYQVGLWQTATASGFAMMFFILIYNTVLMSIAALAAIDQPQRRGIDRFPLDTTCQFTFGNHTYSGYTNDLSEKGASITLMTDDVVAENHPVIVTFPEHNFFVEAKVCRLTPQKNYTIVSLEFPNITVEQNRQLVTMLYSDMTWWKQSKRPGSLDVFLAMFVAFLKLTPLMSKYERSKVIG